MSSESTHALDQPHGHVVHIDDEGSKTGMWLFLFTELLLFGERLEDVLQRRLAKRTDQPLRLLDHAQHRPQAANDGRLAGGAYLKLYQVRAGGHLPDPDRPQKYT